MRHERAELEGTLDAQSQVRALPVSQNRCAGDSEFARRLLEFALEGTVAEAPELHFWQAIQDERGRLDQLAVAFLWREMCKSANDWCIEFSALLRSGA